MFFDNPQNKLICVFGLGMSGLATARYLQRIGKVFFVVDSRTNPPAKDQIKDLSFCAATHFGVIPQDKLNNTLMIVLSPGVSKNIVEITEASENGVRIVGDVEIFVNQTENKIIAITGSNGKSTVTDLTYRLLLSAGINAKIGGNFGLPVLDYLPEDDADIYVLELSSFQLDTTQSLRADVAVVLNITEDHMDRYKSFSEYRKSKLSVFNNAKISIKNGDDKQISIDKNINKNQFSLIDHRAQYHLDAEKYLVINDNRLIKSQSLKLTGKHNWSNALVALAILTELKLELSPAVLLTLKQYEGLAHRFQLVEKNEKIEWINDSKATNVGATEAALAGIDKNKYSAVVLIAGGDAKGGDLTPLKSFFVEKISRLVLIGKDANLFAEIMPAAQIYFATDMLDAVKNAADFVNKNTDINKRGLILLSPACASLDMYKNFEARGQAFVDAIEQIKACA